MSAPNNQEYGTASAAAYTLTQSSGFILPPGWSIVQESSRAQRSDGFAAVALKDPSGNIIIANEGTVAGGGAYSRGTLAADLQITNGQSPQALADARAFAKSVQQLTNSSTIYVTGHSLGGTEAEAEAQALGTNCAGGVTFGATGLPGNTQSGPSSLIDYVDYGDPVGNYASDSSSPLNSIAPAGMNHFGLVVMTGLPSNAADLRSAASEINSAVADTTGDGSPLALAALAQLTLAVQYHTRSAYASDLGIPSLAPPLSSGALDSDAAAVDFRLFGLPLGQAGVQNAGAATPGSDGTVDSPDVNVTINPTTNQVTLDQSESVVTASGGTQAPNVATIAIDPANQVVLSVEGPNASAATIDLSGNTFTVGAIPGVDANPIANDNGVVEIVSGGQTTILSGYGAGSEPVLSADGETLIWSGSGSTYSYSKSTGAFYYTHPLTTDAETDRQQAVFTRCRGGAGSRA
jgi:hypothetical protein